jgi:CRP-like cAMP-binding protein
MIGSFTRPFGTSASVDDRRHSYHLTSAEGPATLTCSATQLPEARGRVVGGLQRSKWVEMKDRCSTIGDSRGTSLSDSIDLVCEGNRKTAPKMPTPLSSRAASFTSSTRHCPPSDPLTRRRHHQELRTGDYAFRACLLEALRKQPKTRTEEDLLMLKSWAENLCYRDAEVQRMVDPLALCKAMKFQATSIDEIVITQGEEGDAFFAVFEGAASVYVSYDAEQPTAQNKVLSHARIRRVRRHERGEYTPDVARRAPASQQRRASASVSDLVTTSRNGTLNPCCGADTLTEPRRTRRSSTFSTTVTMTRGAQRRKSSITHLASLLTADAPAKKSAEKSPVEAEGGSILDTIKRVYTYREHDSFGDLALLFGAPRSASVVAEKNTILVRVDRSDYNAVIRQAHLDAVRQRAQFLSIIPSLAQHNLAHLGKVASYMKCETYATGATVLTGEQLVNEDILIVQEGDVEVRRRINCGVPALRLLTFGLGTCLGALRMEAGVSRLLLPSLIAARGGCKILRLKRDEFRFRAGKEAVARMQLDEASAWLSRLQAPGLLRRLVVTPKFVRPQRPSSSTSWAALPVPVMTDTRVLRRPASTPSLYRSSKKSSEDELTEADLINWLNMSIANVVTETHD